MTERPILWAPSPERANATSMARFIRWLGAERGLEFADYNALWDWSVSDLEGFWQAIVDFFALEIEGGEAVLASRAMPGAEWFPGARVSYPAHVLRHAAARGQAQALIGWSESFGRRELTWAELADQVARAAAGLRRLGVGQGDRVVAILPNSIEAMVAFLATSSIGAIWSLAAPDMGPVAVLDRFRQIDPKLLIAQDSYILAGKRIDRRDLVTGISDGLPGLAARVHVPATDTQAPQGWALWDDLLAGPAPDGFAPVPVPFDHPLWIVYSSGTTGNPKPIVHGHGGLVLECAKASLHMDLGADDRFAWLTSSGWIMWNAQFFGLMQGATVVLYPTFPK